MRSSWGMAPRRQRGRIAPRYEHGGAAPELREVDKSLTPGRFVRSMDRSPARYCGGKCSTCAVTNSIYWMVPGVHQVRLLRAHMLHAHMAELAAAVMYLLDRAEFTGRQVRECLNCGEVWLRNSKGEPMWLDVAKAASMIRH